MQEPVAGINAVPDERNARYFHVVVAGPEDVSAASHVGGGIIGRDLACVWSPAQTQTS